MESLDSSILIRDVSYQEPWRAYGTYKIAGRDGARIYNSYKEKATVTVSFDIREYDIEDRQTVCQTVCAWAKNGGVLKVNDRPDQQLKCICETLPSITSALRWTETLNIVFAAYALPYWQDTTETTTTLTGTSGSGTLSVPGYRSRCFER